MRRARAWDRGCVARTRKAGGGKGSRMIFFFLLFFFPGLVMDVGRWVSDSRRIRGNLRRYNSAGVVEVAHVPYTYGILGESEK